MFSAVFLHKHLPIDVICDITAVAHTVLRLLFSIVLFFGSRDNVDLGFSDWIQERSQKLEVELKELETRCSVQADGKRILRATRLQ